MGSAGRTMAGWAPGSPWEDATMGSIGRGLLWRGVAGTRHEVVLGTQPQGKTVAE